MAEYQVSSSDIMVIFHALHTQDNTQDDTQDNILTKKEKYLQSAGCRKADRKLLGLWVINQLKVSK